MKTMHGVLHVHAETGTEGGWWAFQDEKYIGTREEERCRKCGGWWANAEDEPDGDRRIGDYVLRACKRGEHYYEVKTVPSWDYAGLHVLRSGDFLTIYQPSVLKFVLWTGEVKLQHTPMEKWHRTEPVEFDLATWREWFVKEYPAMLTVGKTK